MAATAESLKDHQRSSTNSNVSGAGLEREITDEFNRGEPVGESVIKGGTTSSGLYGFLLEFVLRSSS